MKIKWREGHQLAEALDPERFREKLSGLVEYHNFWFENYFEIEGVDLEETYESTLVAVDSIRSMIGDTIEVSMLIERPATIFYLKGRRGHYSILIMALIHLLPRQIPQPAVQQPEVATAPCIWITFLGLRRPIPPESGLDRFPLNCLTKSDNTWPP